MFFHIDYKLVFFLQKNSIKRLLADPPTQIRVYYKNILRLFIGDVEHSLSLDFIVVCWILGLPAKMQYKYSAVHFSNVERPMALPNKEQFNAVGRGKIQST